MIKRVEHVSMLIQKLVCILILKPRQLICIKTPVKKKHLRKDTDKPP